MSEEAKATKPEIVGDEPVSIQKPPEEFSLERFKSKRTAASPTSKRCRTACHAFACRT
jgi:hypothetical protein